MKKVKGLSPVIATVLLIAMVIVLALIIFLWFRGMSQEAITKFDDKNVELVCRDVVFAASYSGTTLSIQNNGGVPIFAMKIGEEGGGSYDTIDLQGTWPDKGLNPGRTFSGEVTVDVDATKLTLIPVLIGNSDDGKKTYVCDKEFGEEISIE